MSTIPTKRGRAAEVVIAVCSVVLFILGMWCSDVKTKGAATVAVLTICLLTIMLSEIIIRACLVCEEIFHLRSRYNGIWNLLAHAFTFSKPFIFLSVVLLFLSLYIYQTYDSPLKVMDELDGWLIICYVAALLFHSLLYPKFGPLYQAITIGNLNGLDYGSAMAYSFYHGYLQIVLPHKGTEQKGIKELIADFEAKEGVTFGYKKLLVLIPLSLHCPITVEEKSNIVESSKSLGEIILSRAGVNRRVYKNTAYKIIVNSGEKMYVCVEYATPLQTLFDIVNHRHEHTNDYALQSKELALQFYLTCQQLLNSDPDCKDCCDLIFFDDKTESGDYVDVGQVVLDHINKCRTKCKKNV